MGIKHVSRESESDLVARLNGGMSERVRTLIMNLCSESWEDGYDAGFKVGYAMSQEADDAKT